jgi:hypothetical protein
VLLQINRYVDDHGRTDHFRKELRSGWDKKQKVCKKETMDVKKKDHRLRMSVVCYGDRAKTKKNYFGDRAKTKKKP